MRYQPYGKSGYNPRNHGIRANSKIPKGVLSENPTARSPRAPKGISERPVRNIEGTDYKQLAKDIIKLSNSKGNKNSQALEKKAQRLERIAKKKQDYADSLYKKNLDALYKKYGVEKLDLERYWNDDKYANEWSKAYSDKADKAEAEAMKFFDSKEYMQADDKAQKAWDRADEIRLNKDLWDGALLKDLGYANTKTGREYIRKLYEEHDDYFW